MIYHILWIIVLHFIADWWLQTQWQAANKSKNCAALTAHVATYTFILCTPAAAWWSLAWLWWALLNGVLHFITDAVTSRITARHWNAGIPDKLFWNTIGTDQCIHMVTLIGTYWWMIGGSREP